MAYFGKFYSTRTPMMGSVDEFLGSRRGDVWAAPADIYETEDGVVVLLDLPGVSAEDVEIHVEGEGLTVRGARREVCPHCKKSYRQMELRYGPFERSLVLPCPVREGTATLRNGVLEIFLPRARRKTAGVLVVRVTI